MKRINIYSTKLVKEKGGNYNLPSKAITSPDTAYNVIETVLRLSEEPVEKFGIFSLNNKNEVIGVHILHMGDVNSSIVSMRSIFQAALLNNATSIICYHNHPSGNPEPSNEDIQITNKIKEAGKLLNIQLLDHVIVGDNNRYVSLKERDVC